MEAGGAGDSGLDADRIEARVLAHLSSLLDLEARNPQLLLQPDLFREALVLRNLGALSCAVSLKGLQGIAIGCEKGDGAAEAPSVRALAVAAGPEEALELDLGPGAAVHLWKPERLERYLRRGGYRGDRRVRAELEAGLSLRVRSPLFAEGSDRRLTAVPGLAAPFAASLSPLDPRLREAPAPAGSWTLEGDPRVRLEPETARISFGRDLPAGSEVPLVLSAGKLSLSFTARIEAPVLLDELEAKSGKLLARARARLEGLQAGPVEAVLRRGEETVARTRGELGGTLELDAGLGRKPAPPEPLLLEVSWNEVPVRRQVLLEAEVDLGAGVEGPGLRHVGHAGGGDGQSEPAEAAGRRFRAPRPRPGGPGARGAHYLYFDLDPAFVPGGPTEIAVELLDSWGGWLELHYDSCDEELPLGGAYKPTARVEVKDTGAVKTHAFPIEDSAFRGRQNFGADFRIAASGPLRVGKVRARKAEP
ncbi:MAG: hypothetical protein HY721_23770 [Planctomycetes bacterium]|nr:hypothetical protein [Planctomycetota bacterium]